MTFVPLVINSWVAKQLQAQAGTSLRVAYYEPEVEKGNEIERTFDAIVASVVPITEPAEPFRRDNPPEFTQRPTVYNDTALTPIVPGVTDQESINDWDLPFQLKREISSSDDEYWNNHRLTPKAFLPAEDGKNLFGSRFGSTTGIRFASEAATDAGLLEQRIVETLKPIQADLGWSIRDIRQSQLAASRGTTPFDGLFLSLSFFVILAAILLIAMLFRLGLIARTKQLGTLMAVGWPSKRVSRLTLGEGLLVALLGVLLGIVLGIAYAWFVLWALRSWWIGAVTVPFLTFHWTWEKFGHWCGGWLGSRCIDALHRIAMVDPNYRSLSSERQRSRCDWRFRPSRHEEPAAQAATTGNRNRRGSDWNRVVRSDSIGSGGCRSVCRWRNDAAGF